MYFRFCGRRHVFKQCAIYIYIYIYIIIRWLVIIVTEFGCVGEQCVVNYNLHDAALRLRLSSSFTLMKFFSLYCHSLLRPQTWVWSSAISVSVCRVCLFPHLYIAHGAKSAFLDCLVDMLSTIITIFTSINFIKIYKNLLLYAYIFETGKAVTKW